MDDEKAHFLDMKTSKVLTNKLFVREFERHGKHTI